jgi:hypothetical protein
VFVHRRTTKSGFSAIVVATLENIGMHRRIEWHSDTPIFFLHTQTIATAGDRTRPPSSAPVDWVENPFLGDPTRGVVTGIRKAFGISGWSKGDIRILAGQIDPSDSARFTIPVEIDGRRNSLVGELTDKKLVDRAGVYQVNYEVVGPDKPVPATDILIPTDD